MNDPDPEQVAAINSESDLENASEEVQNAYRPADKQTDTSYAEISAVLSDADDA